MSSVTKIGNFSGALEDTGFGLSFNTMKGKMVLSADASFYQIKAPAAGNVSLYYMVGATKTFFTNTDFTTGVYLKSDGLYIGATKVVSASASATSFYWQATNDFSGSMTDAFEVAAVTSGGVASSFVSASVVVTAINDAPLGGNGSVTFNEGSVYQFKAADFPVNDTKDISGSLPSGNGFQGIYITSLPSVGSLTLSGAAVKVGDYIDVSVIGSLVFTPVNTDAHADSYASFGFKVRDNGGTLNGGVDTAATASTLTINVNSVNDAPSGADHAVTIDEDTTYTFQSSDFALSDTHDSPANLLHAVKITSVPAGGTLHLVNGSTSTPVNTGDFVSAADIAAGYLVYTPAQDANGNGYGTFTFQVQDDGGTANGGVNLDPLAKTFTINVTPVNDPPVNTVPSAQTVNEDTALSISGVSVNDVDGNLTSTQLSVAHGALNVTLNGATISAGANGSGTLTLSGTQVQINAALATLSYQGNSNYNGSDTLTVLSTDSNGATDSNTVAITVNPVNDAPVLDASLVREVTIPEDSVTSETPGTPIWMFNWGYSQAEGKTIAGATDVDVQNAPNGYQSLGIAVTGVAGVTGGTVEWSADGGATWHTDTPVAGEALLLGGDALLRYTPPLNANGDRTITFHTWDGTGGYNTGDHIAVANIVTGGTSPFSVATATHTLHITPVNDAPVAVADSYNTTTNLTLNVDAAHGVLANDTDVEHDGLTAVLVGNVAHGALTLNADGSFVYTPTAGYSGSDSFTYKANDGQADGNTVTVNLAVGVATPVVTAVSHPAPGYYNDTDASVDHTPNVLVFKVTYDAVVHVHTGSGANTPTIDITVGSTVYHAAFTGYVNPVSYTAPDGSTKNASDQLVFKYTVQAGDNDADGVAVNVGDITLNGASITAISGGSDTGVVADPTLHGIFNAANSDVVVDTTAPVVPSTDPDSPTVINHALAVSGFQFHGTGEVGATVVLFDGGTGATAGAYNPDPNSGNEIGTAIVQADGTWSITIPSHLIDPNNGVPTDGSEDGTHHLGAFQTDKAGNTGPTDFSTLVIDTQVPNAPLITSVIDDDGGPGTHNAYTGDVANNGYTNDTTPTLNGTAEANATIKIYNGTSFLGQTTADKSGDWSYTTSALSNATTYTFHTVAVDAAGNASSASGTRTITIDTDVPANAPVVTQAYSIINLQLVQSGFSTEGHGADPYARVVMYDDADNNETYTPGEKVFGDTQADSSGAWTMPVAASTFPTDGSWDGIYNLRWLQLDAAANASPSTDPRVTLLVDTQAPTVGISSTIGTNTGLTSTITSGGLTKDNTLTLSGTYSDAHFTTGTVTIKDGTTELGNATLDGSGGWTYTTDALGDGAHSFTATATDDAGNSIVTSAITATLDTTADVGHNLSVSLADSLINSDEQSAVAYTITGLDADATATVTFTDHLGGHVNGSAGTADLSALADGAITVSISAADVAGNTASGTGASLTLDTTPPDAPTSLGLLASSDSGASNTDDLTNVALPTLRVSFLHDGSATAAKAGDTVNVFDSSNAGAVLATVTLTGSDISAGYKDVTLTSSLLEGQNNLNANIIDVAGNTGGTSADLQVTLDTTIAQPTVALANDTTDGGSGHDTDKVTSDATLATSQKASDVTRSFTVDSGTASSSYVPPTTDGSHTVVVTDTDFAGNTKSANLTFTLDTSADKGTPLSVTINDGDGYVNNAEKGAVSFTVAGLDSDATAVITFSDGTNTVATSVNADGSATADLSGLTEGTITATIAATDTAGNHASGTSDSSTKDTIAPAVVSVAATEDAGATPLAGGFARTDLTAGAGNTVSLGDVNGDGRLDIVTSSSWGNSVSVLLQQADGSFAAPTDLATGSNPHSVSLGDVNGDGKLDIVTANLDYYNSVSVLLQQGDGSFARTDLPTEFLSGLVSLGDINGDGKLDIVAAQASSNGISVLLQQSDGSFSRTYVDTGVSPYGVSLGDINGDHKLDIVTAGSNGVLLLLQQADGSFARTDLATGVSPYDVSLGDVNGDGRLDIVTANVGNNSVSVWLQQADGSFSENYYATGSSPFSVSLGDINGDNKLDIVTTGSNGVSVLLQQVDGSFARPDLAVGSGPSSVSLGDVNGDGKLDIVTVGSNGVSVLTQQTSGLKVGQTLDFTVHFGEAVVVDTTGGNPTLALTLDNVTGDQPVAQYLSHSGNDITFRYTVQAGDFDNNGVNLGAISLNGATIRDAAGNDATLALHNVASTATILVDGVAPTLTISDNQEGYANINNPVVTYTFSFSEGVKGFDASDISATHGTIDTTSFQQVDASHYTVNITAQDGYEGDLTVNVAAGALTDLVGNASTTGAQSTQAVDTLAPDVGTVSFTSVTENSNDPSHDNITNPPALAGLKGAYYAGIDGYPDPSSIPFAVQTDTSIDFHGVEGDGGVLGSGASSYFAVRWTGQLRVDTAGSYSFSTISDDGSLVYIDGSLVVYNDGAHAAQLATGTADLGVGVHSVEILYDQFGGGYDMTFSYTPPGGNEQTSLTGNFSYALADSIVFTYSGNDLKTGEYFQYSTDGWNWVNIVAGNVDATHNTVTITGLDITASPTVQLRAIDAAGNATATLASQQIIYDTTAPTAGTLSFTGLTDTGSFPDTPVVTQDGTFDLTLTGDTDTNGIGSVVYQQKLGSGDWVNLTGDSSNKLSGLADGSYQFRAVVTDNAGNSSTTDAISVVVDNTAPTAGTLSFAAGTLTDTGHKDTPVAITTDDTFTLTLTGAADTNAFTTVYEKSTDDGSTWSSTTEAQSSLADGSYQFHAIVTDAAGNSSTSNAISVVVDKTNPTAGALSFTGLTDSGSADTPPVTTDDTFTLTLTGAADTNAFTTVYEKSTDGGSTWSSTTEAQSSLADGSYQFHAIVTDAAGNSATTDAISMVVDNTAPVTGTLGLTNFTDTGASGSDHVTSNGTFDLSKSGAATDANGVETEEYLVSINGAPAVVTGASQVGLADGGYLFYILATDHAGNIGSSDPVRVVVDTTAPTAQFEAADYNSASNTLTLTGVNVDTLINTAAGQYMATYYAGTGEYTGSDVKAQLDLSKIGWDFNSDGTVDYGLAGRVTAAYVLDDSTLVLVTDGSVETQTGYGTRGSSSVDTLQIQNGFASDLAGNAAANDGASLTIQGDLNLPGLPQSYSIDFGTAGATVVNDTLGADTGGHGITLYGSPWNPSGTQDQVHISGVSAAQVSVGSSLLAYSQSADDLTIHGVKPDGSGLGNYVNINVDAGVNPLDAFWNLAFDDGSMLEANTWGGQTTLSGGSFGDQLIAGNNGDRLSGNAGDDLLIGGAGADSLYGGTGNDVLFGWGGNDYLSGGSGADLFVYTKGTGISSTGYSLNDGRDSITGFQHGIDKIWIADASGTLHLNVDKTQLLDNSGLVATVSQSGADTLLTLNGTESIRLLGIQKSTISDVDFTSGAFTIDGGHSLV